MKLKYVVRQRRKKINHEETYPKVVFKINKEFRHPPRKKKNHASNHILYRKKTILQMKKKKNVMYIYFLNFSFCCFITKFRSFYSK